MINTQNKTSVPTVVDIVEKNTQNKNVLKTEIDFLKTTVVETIRKPSVNVEEKQESNETTGSATESGDEINGNSCRNSGSYETKVSFASAKKNDVDDPFLKDIMQKDVPSIRVVARFRPLVGDEIIRGDKELPRKNKLKSENNVLLTVQSTKEKTDFRGKVRKTKLFQGDKFTYVCETSNNNLKTFNKTIIPIIPTVMNGSVASCFCYGHTGSGKTHTALGYGEEKGMYYLAADRIGTYLNEVRKIEGLEDVSMNVRFAEMHLRKFYDLLNDRAECYVRETVNGIEFRGKIEKELKEETMYYGFKKAINKVKINPLVAKNCISADEVEKAILSGMKYRQVGTSTLHEQSSRSHAFMEIEIVTNEIIKLRNDIVDLEGEANEAMCRYSAYQCKQYYEPDQYDIKVYNALKDTHVDFKNQLKKKHKILKATMKKLKLLHPCIGGMLVFIDLAGSEHGNDLEQKNRSSESLREGKAINISLMALNEVMRNLYKSKKSSTKSSRVPWRGSYLTQCLKKYLNVENSTCTMMVNLSPSVLHEKKTKATLLYASQMTKIL